MNFESHATKDKLKEFRKFVSSSLKDLGLSDNDRDDLVFVCGEALLNIIKISYAGGDDSKTMKIDISKDNNKIILKFFDNGTKLVQEDLLNDPLNSLKESNLSNFFINEIMDEVILEETDNWINCIKLSKQLS
tara:strand:+ start:818 stop:1216 length:399 start_codon:yes stop_codon:yes gene_type:complete